MPTLKPPKSPKESSKATKAFFRSQPQPLNKEEAFEANEAQF